MQDWEEMSAEGHKGWNLHAGNIDLRMAVMYEAILKRPEF
jgi:hypothetical protein